MKCPAGVKPVGIVVCALGASYAVPFLAAMYCIPDIPEFLLHRFIQTIFQFYGVSDSTAVSLSFTLDTENVLTHGFLAFPVLLFIGWEVFPRTSIRVLRPETRAWGWSCSRAVLVSIGCLSVVLQSIASIICALSFSGFTNHSWKGFAFRAWSTSYAGYGVGMYPLRTASTCAHTIAYTPGMFVFWVVLAEISLLLALSCAIGLSAGFIRDRARRLALICGALLVLPLISSFVFTSALFLPEAFVNVAWAIIGAWYGLVAVWIAVIWRKGQSPVQDYSTC